MTVHKGHRERMRSRFIEYGLDNFSDHEVLELLLYYAIPQGDVNPLAHELIDKFGSLSGVFEASTEELLKVSGVKERTAAFLHLMPPLFRRYQLSKHKTDVFDTSDKIGPYMTDYYIGHVNELLTIVMMDNSSHILAIKKLAEGDPNSVRINYRLLLTEVLKYNAPAVIIAHNHPGGLCTPSRQDIIETRMIRDILNKIGVRLIDHIIVAGNEWSSVLGYTR